MAKGKINTEITKKMTELDKLYSSDKWMYQRGTKQIGREIKVREGVYLYHKTIKTKEESYGVTCEIEYNRVKKITVAGEHFPIKIDKNKFKEELMDMEYDKNKLANKIISLIKSYGVEIID
jgi:hypothetical protein